jgi:hypothetical protein
MYICLENEYTVTEMLMIIVYCFIILKEKEENESELIDSWARREHRYLHVHAERDKRGEEKERDG